MDLSSEVIGMNTSSSSSPQQQERERKIFGALMAADNHQHNNQMLPFGRTMHMPSPSPSPPNFNINKSGGANYELGELDQALFQYLDVQPYSAQDQPQNCGGMKHTLNIFPSEPMHVEPSETSSKGQSAGFVCAAAETSMSFSYPTNGAGSSAPPHEPAKEVQCEGNGKGPASSSEQEPKTPDPKILRRLAQNREAARKSRLRKKAYVQQLESSRMRLAQLEQEIQAYKSQGIHLGGGSPMMVNINASADVALFEMEYRRWVEEHSHRAAQLRRAVYQEQPPSEQELHMLVNSYVALYDELMEVKATMAKADAFHIFSGVWKTPAERCFMWMGGFRPSHLIRVISRQIEAPLTDEQLMGLYALQRSTEEGEEALSQGMEALSQSISQLITSESLITYMNATYTAHMNFAASKLSTLEGFIYQGDNLRRITFRRLQNILTARQSVRFFLAVAEFFHRLRTLSSLWKVR